MAAGGTAAGGAAPSSGGSVASGGTGGSAPMQSGGASAMPSGGAPSATGGASASGGSGGAGGSKVNDPCSSAWFCSGFEEGTIPSELVFYPEYLRAQIDDFVQTDGATAHDGAYSLRITGMGFSQMLGIPTSEATFWARLYLRTNPESLDPHSSYVLATDGSGDPNDGEAIRVGEHKCQLELNRKTDDAELLSNGGTYECSGGIQLTADTWYCLEAFYDGVNGEVRIFVDGSEVPALHARDWGPYDYALFKFGFESYHGASKTVWYDDVGVGPERLGCD